MSEGNLAAYARRGIELLAQRDPVLFDLLEREYDRQARVLTLVASSSIGDPAVLACESMPTMNVTAEGYPEARFHAGCKYIDKIEQLAIDRAKAAFKAHYANVQPLSATTANQIVMMSLLRPGETLLGMQLDAGGHLTHGAKASISGQYFNAIGYGLDENGGIDYAQVEALAREHRPKLIICGTTAYPRMVDFARFRRIADHVGAYLLADITHIAGLVVAGLHPSPIDDAHFTTTCTHKQLYGPRGGLVLIGKEHETLAPDGKTTLARMIQKSVFPLLQGAPNLSMVAAKAITMERIMTPEFRAVAQRIVACARELARCLAEKGYRVITGGTDNHIVVIEVLSGGITGLVAEKALEECGIVVNKNRIPGDTKPPLVTSGVRLGTNIAARRGMGPAEMGESVELIHRVLSSVRALGDREFAIDEEVKRSVLSDVERLCCRFPIPDYPFRAEAELPALVAEPRRACL